MGTILNPDRKFIARSNFKDWMLVRISTIERILKRAPWTPFSALNISRHDLTKYSKLRRIKRNIERRRGYGL